MKFTTTVLAIAVLFVQTYADPVKHTSKRAYTSHNQLSTAYQGKSACKCPSQKIAHLPQHRLSRRMDPSCIAALSGIAVSGCCVLICTMDQDYVCDVFGCNPFGDLSGPPMQMTMEDRPRTQYMGEREMQERRQQKFAEWKVKHKKDLEKTVSPERSFECGICLESSPRDGDCRTKLKACQQHQFCYTCISTWYDVRKTALADCPTCRKKFSDDDILPDLFGVDSKCDSACGITKVEKSRDLAAKLQPSRSFSVERNTPDVGIRRSRSFR